MKRGFSAWEEVIVLAVIAIMVSVIYQRYKIIRREALKTQVRIEVSNLRLAIELYKVKNDKFPKDLYELYKKGYLYYKGFKTDKNKRELLDRLGNAYIYDRKTGNVYVNPKTLRELR